MLAIKSTLIILVSLSTKEIFKSLMEEYSVKDYMDELHNIDQRKICKALYNSQYSSPIILHSFRNCKIELCLQNAPVAPFSLCLLVAPQYVLLIFTA